MKAGTKQMQIVNNLHAFIWQSPTANNCNAYFIDGPTRILIDPGHRALCDHVELGLRDLGLKTDDIDLVICTHAHPDHLEAVPLFKEKSALFTLHEIEWDWAATIGKQMSAAFGIDIDALTPDFFLKEGTLSLDGLEMQVFLTPGHSPGSICLYWPMQKALFTGDLVFKDGLGRTDLPGGDGALIKESIKRMSHLDVELLLSGHGEIISGAREVKSNFDHLEEFWFGYV
jgi:hydroxyacylglutathione hydrolase